MTEEQMRSLLAALERERAGYERRRDHAPDGHRDREVMPRRIAEVDEQINRLRPPAQTRLRRGAETR
ncbi:MAG TPA: hypothetical protein VNT51_05830 [Miltoncostaeaceae bacterium]|nr:hypothetical protein [Miltoncostaeaceae bacterium]